ncbi:hypothetical protein HDU79_002160 [Rhizoclosmatium sp. JEL0117]|nr:hypothetical protein HDU79_002160 [Rhizoclosmatium sp. JEL0117]
MSSITTTLPTSSGQVILEHSKYILDLAGYVAIAFSILGLALSLLLLASIYRARRRRMKAAAMHSSASTTDTLLHNSAYQRTSGSYIDGTLVAVLFVIVLYSVQIATENIIWILDWTVLDSTHFLALLGYALMFTLFALNEPQYWLFSPFTMPSTSAKLPNILFLIGMLYFPFASIVTAWIYVYSYHFTMQSFGPEQIGAGLELQTLDNRLSVCTPSKSTIRRAVLLRCFLMSLGLIIFYVPTIVFILVKEFQRIAGQDENGGQEEYPADNLWLYFWLNVLPALDCVWTPCLVLWFQERYREDFVLWITECADAAADTWIKVG